jgi:hypothetical protein
MSTFQKILCGFGGLIFILNILLLAGCAPPTKQVVNFPESLKPVSDKVIIRLIRDSQFRGGGATTVVKDNSKLIGYLSSGGELRWQREPGEMNLQLIPKVGFITGRLYQIHMDTEEGKLYTFRIYCPKDGHIIAELVKD